MQPSVKTDVPQQFTGTDEPPAEVDTISPATHSNRNDKLIEEDVNLPENWEHPPDGTEDRWEWEDISTRGIREPRDASGTQVVLKTSMKAQHFDAKDLPKMVKLKCVDVVHNSPLYRDMLIGSVTTKDVGSLRLFPIVSLPNHIPIAKMVILCTEVLSSAIYWINEGDEFLPAPPPFHVFNGGPALIPGAPVLLHFIALDDHPPYFALPISWGNDYCVEFIDPDTMCFVYHKLITPEHPLPRPPVYYNRLKLVTQIQVSSHALNVDN
ncbi:hypothetical protein M405DRAFT_886133 [Rhizopogon salebrosus TDB-379]|nr:hypothetical protein M405DRAFT_886133 [Rhizopogon salebrosus TDB-379]